MDQMSSGTTAAKLIIDVSSTNYKEGRNLFLVSSQRLEVMEVCFKVKNMMDWNFDYCQFQDILCEHQLPVEVLWSLHFSQVFPLETYLLQTRSKTAPLHERTLQRICVLCLADSKGDSGAIFSQRGILIFLVNNAFDVIDGEIKQICLKILDLVLEGIFSMEKQNLTEELMKPFFDLWCSQMIEESTLKAFCFYTLRYFIKLSHATVLDTFSTQEMLKNKTVSSDIVICKVISTFDYNNLQEFLFNMTSEKDINWYNYLRVIDLVMEEKSKTSTVVQQLVNQLLKQAFQNLNSCSLQEALLIGRQIAMFSESPFPLAFKQWFQAQFADCVPLKNPQTFSFFIQVLSDLTPYENNIEMIKVALELLLHVPSECQLEYTDYIALLKTRVKDLQPQIPTEEILNKLLLAFQENGKIPPYILETSLMQKHYFLNEFLPALLVPRVVPLIPDVREKFILELNRVGKIPLSMLQKYRTACIEEEHKMLAGLDLNDHFMDDL